MNFDSKKVMYRYTVVAALLVVVFVAIIAQAVKIMTKDRQYWEEVQQRYVRSNHPIPATRGNILADDGQLLAASIPEYAIFMDYMSWEKDPKRKAKDQHRRDSLLNDKIDSICSGIQNIMPDIDPAKLKVHLLNGRKRKSHHWRIVGRRLTYIEYRQVEKLPYFNLGKYKSGFHCEEIKTRKNPFGHLASRTIGDLYKGIDSARCGLELGLDSILRGKPGISRRQKVLSQYLTIVEKAPEDGCDVLTTLNVGMQDVCEIALREKLTELEANAGICILMEVATGDVKAITSLTRLGNGTYRETGNIAVSNLMEPGSVFKPMSFLVALNDGMITLDDSVDTGCGIMPMYGQRMKDHNWHKGGYGWMTVKEIIGFSSNIGVSALIDQHYKDKPQNFVDGIYRLGVAEDLKLPLPGYAKPRIPRPDSKTRYWSKTDLPWMSIGYVTQIPPISTLTFYNGIANGGKMMRPRLVKAIMKDGKVVKECPPEIIREQMANPKAISDIQQCLRYVVKEGGGKKIGSKLFNISGKTGTAQVWTDKGFSREYLVSFAGYFPSENPQYAGIVCIRRRGMASGSADCGPVFRRVAETVMAARNSTDYSTARDTRHTGVPYAKAGDINDLRCMLDELNLRYSTNYNAASDIHWGTVETDNHITLNATLEVADIVPDVTGYGLRDAIYRLEKSGLKVKATGRGRVVSQSPKAGTSLKPGETVTLKLATPKIPKL